MRAFKTISVLFLLFLLIQVTSFYLFAENMLPKVIGANYQTLIVDFEPDNFLGVEVFSSIELSQSEVDKFLPKLSGAKVKICDYNENCISKIEKQVFYYVINVVEFNPFKIVEIEEFELAEGYVATWKSEYIWFLFTWIKLKKTNVGAS